MTEPAGWSLVEPLWHDARHAVRVLNRQRGFALTAVGTLAVGIGVATAILTAAWSVLLRPLPVKDEASIVVGQVLRSSAISQSPLTWPSVEAWRGSGVFKQVAAVTSGRGELTDGVAERISIQQVTSNFFGVLGVTAIEGRVFSEDDLAAAETPAVISEPLWRARFGSDPGIVGRRLNTGHLSVIVIGVAPPRFERWRGQAQMWVPAERTISPQERSVGYSLFTAIARVDRPLQQSAIDQLRGITAGVEGDRITGVRLVPLREDVSSVRTRRLMLVLIGGVGLAWLVVCANLSTLLLARGPARAGELAVRLALGASRGRVVALLLMEALILSVPGGALGIAAAVATTQWLRSSASVAGIDTVSLDAGWPVLAAGLALTLLTALACGFAPAFTASRATLAKGATSVELTRSSRRWARTLVVAQIAVSLVVLIGASLLATSAHRIQQVELGFRGDQVLTFQVSLPVARYGSATVTDGPRFIQAQTELLDRLSALPGVEQATFGHGIFAPGSGSAPGTSISLDDGRRFLNGDPKTVAFTPGWNYIGPYFFAVHGVTLARGRELTDADHAGSARVIVVNEAAAALYWPNQDPLGKRINFGSRRPPNGFDEPWAEVVGVVPDIRHAGADSPARPYVYRAALQNPRREFEVMLRTSVPPASVANAARTVVRDFDSSIPMYAARPLSDTVAQATADVRQSATLLGGLAMLTVLLAAAGVFSVLAYVVSLRRRDLAIRSVLGATPAVLVRSAAGQAVWLVAAGLGLGLVLAYATTRSLGALLHDVAPTDPATFAGATALLAALASAAAAIPARRAARIDPVTELK